MLLPRSLLESLLHLRGDRGQGGCRQIAQRAFFRAVQFAHRLIAPTDIRMAALGKLAILRFDLLRSNGQRAYLQNLAPVHPQLHAECVGFGPCALANASLTRLQ